MELDERKTIILKAIIKSYLETGQPVGSRTISRLSGLSLSSATIRNEMSDLVDMGYILQPHTSAGRVPTDKGYRFYVDSIMDEYSENITAVTGQLTNRIDTLEQLLKRLVRMIAANTDYAALISGPNTGTVRIKYIQLSVSAPGQVLLVLVLEGNVIKNELLETVEDVDYQTAMDLTILINNHLSGLSLKEITPRVVTSIMVEAGNQQSNVKLIMDTIVEQLESGEADRDVFTSGAKNLFKYPELFDKDKATRLVSIFEEKDVLKGMVNEVTQMEDPDARGRVRIYIGGEGPIRDMEDYSLITADYELGDGMKGIIGVIGPKRMDYEKVLKTLNDLGNQMNDAFGKGKAIDFPAPKPIKRLTRKKD